MIYIVWAPPRQGKTFYCTWLAIKELKKGKSVFSNYPIVHEEKKLFKKPEILSTKIWKSDFVYHDITDSTIIIDEGYRDFSSREFKKFDTDKHTFFATNGHNNNDIYVIAQNPARVDLIIREMTNVFIFVRKACFIGSDKPLWFRVEGFLSIEDFAQRYHNPNAVYTSMFLLPKRYIKKAYDTHYYRCASEKHDYFTWYEEYTKIKNNEESG